jgi:hypothetical protein
MEFSGFFNNCLNKNLREIFSFWNFLVWKVSGVFRYYQDISGADYGIFGGFQNGQYSIKACGFSVTFKSTKNAMISPQEFKN